MYVFYTHYESLMSEVKRQDDDNNNNNNYDNVRVQKRENWVVRSKEYSILTDLSAVVNK
jgi:hypothetical protein